MFRLRFLLLEKGHFSNHRKYLTIYPSFFGENRKMKAKNYFTINTGAYFASENPEYLIIQENAEWKVYLSNHFCGRSFNGDLVELETDAYGTTWWTPVEIDAAKLKRYMQRNAKPEKWRNWSTAFKEKHATDCVMDGPHLAAKWVVDGKKKMEVHYYGFLESENQHPHYHSACKLLRYLQRNGKFEKSILDW